METRELGVTGIRIPEIGLGTWEYRGGVAPLRRGIELGITFIDTAEGYRTENVVGEAIRGKRDQVFLATKVSGDSLRYREVLRAADASLKRLETDVIDLYQVHWPDPSVPIGETMGAMEALVEAGKIRYIGLSNFTRKELEEAQASLKHERIVANQIIYSLARRTAERDIPYYASAGITVIAYSPYARGALLTGRGRGGDTAQAVATEAQKTVAQVVLNWCLSRPGVIPIPKTDQVERVDEIAGASGWSLTAEQVQRLDEAFP